MAGGLFVRVRGTAGGGAETFKGGALFDRCGLNGERIGGKIVVVFSVRDSGLEGLADKSCRFARNEAEDFDCLGGIASLDGAGNIAHFNGRHPGVFGVSLNLHFDEELGVLKSLNTCDITGLNGNLAGDLKDESGGALFTRSDNEDLSHGAVTAFDAADHTPAQALEQSPFDDHEVGILTGQDFRNRCGAGRIEAFGNKGGLRSGPDAGQSGRDGEEAGGQDLVHGEMGVHERWVFSGSRQGYFLPAWCDLKVRVGANSPSLWPTMFSVT